jgi:hypothetical protein
MANTITEYGYLSTDMILKGISETIVKESPILQKMPFKDIQGNSLKYNLETVLATAGWYNVNEQWTESTPQWTQRSVGLSILGDNADVDQFAQQTLSNVQDQEAAIIELTAKAIAHEFERCFIYGGTTTTANAKEFKGLLQIIAEFEGASVVDLDALNNSQVIANHATSAVLSLASLDKLIDAVKPGKPDLIIMSRMARRYLNGLARTTSGSPLQWRQNEFGLFVEMYNGIDIAINDFLQDNFPDNSTSVAAIASMDYDVTRADTVNNFPIFAVKFGENAVCGLQNGGITIEDIGKLENKDAIRKRIKWYCGAAAFNKFSAAVMIGATDA